MTENIISFTPRTDHRAIARRARLDDESITLNDLSADLGTPDEWLASAIEHLKSCNGCKFGSVLVSAAALDLVLMRLEALENGGQPSRGSAA